MFTIYGLLSRKVWSYKLALAVPMLLVVSWFAQAALYMSAPPSLGLVSSTNYLGLGMSLFWLLVFWLYLRRPHVKQYLRRIPLPTAPYLQNSANAVPGTHDVPPSRWTPFVQCPYCGHQNRIEANYCEKCGRPRSHTGQIPPPPQG